MLWNSCTAQLLYLLGTQKQTFAMNTMIQSQDKLLEIITLTPVDTAGQMGKAVPQATRQVLQCILLCRICFKKAYSADRIRVAGPFFL